MSTKINAQIVADSLSPQGKRLTSVLITHPRFILAEINTHRMLSKNTSSSRAIPFNKIMETIQNDPFIPIAWQKEHKGMQGSEYLTTNYEISHATNKWLEARDYAIDISQNMNYNTVTKQLCNRLLEPFMWTTMLITGSEEGWNNFFELRCPQYAFKSLQTGIETFYKSKKDLFKSHPDSNMDYATDLEWLQINEGQAEIHMMQLAECVYDAMNESTPKQLKAGEWHIPFEDKIIMSILDQQEISKTHPSISSKEDLKVRISTAMAARTSYTIVGDEKGIDYKKMIELHDRLIIQDPLHASPMEHCAKAMSDEQYYRFVRGEISTRTSGEYGYEILGDVDEANYGWCRNYQGFIQYRHILETQK